MWNSARQGHAYPYGLAVIPLCVGNTAFEACSDARDNEIGSGSPSLHPARGVFRSIHEVDQQLTYRQHVREDHWGAWYTNYLR